MLIAKLQGGEIAHTQYLSTRKWFETGLCK